MSNLTLSITTIGDLLLKNRITKDKSGKSIDNIKLSVPDYQRPYKWTARNAIQLLDDIIEARNNNKEVYRVGTLILHRDKTKEREVYNIVDGQQRVITFSLLLQALPKYENEQTGEIDFLNQKLYTNTYTCHNISNNLNAFRRRVQTNDGDRDFKSDMERLRDYIESRCELIVIITEDLSEAFQFFDSQNARGKALYPHDLLKAYHLREMAGLDEDKVEKIVKDWESIPQYELASFFGDYVYRIREWIKGDWAYGLSESNIYKFKGVTKDTRTPYAQFYKGAYAYAEYVNTSSVPFVTGAREMTAFQLNAPIIAGKPSFEYTRHYYDILEDIRDNSQYEGFYIKGDEIVKTLDTYFSGGVGNRIARLLFDTALLLYVDRFCPATYPTKLDTDLFGQFEVFAFVWAYSLRAQYTHLGWRSAQNYVLGGAPVKNSVNIYKLIVEADTPASLLSAMADRLVPISFEYKEEEDEAKVKKHYGYYFKKHQFLIEKNNGK